MDLLDRLKIKIFADGADFDGIVRLSKNPVMNTRREFTGPVIEELSQAGVCVNVTAVMTLQQVQLITQRLAQGTAAIVSVFAGRIADTGRDPVPEMAEAV